MKLRFGLENVTEKSFLRFKYFFRIPKELFTESRQNKALSLFFQYLPVIKDYPIIFIENWKDFSLEEHEYKKFNSFHDILLNDSFKTLLQSKNSKKTNKKLAWEDIRIYSGKNISDIHKVESFFKSYYGAEFKICINDSTYVVSDYFSLMFDFMITYEYALSMKNSFIQDLKKLIRTIYTNFTDIGFVSQCSLQYQDAKYNRVLPILNVQPFELGNVLELYDFKRFNQKQSAEIQFKYKGSLHTFLEERNLETEDVWKLISNSNTNGNAEVTKTNDYILIDWVKDWGKESSLLEAATNQEHWIYSWFPLKELNDNYNPFGDMIAFHFDKKYLSSGQFPFKWYCENVYREGIVLVEGDFKKFKESDTYLRLKTIQEKRKMGRISIRAIYFAFLDRDEALKWYDFIQAEFNRYTLYFDGNNFWDVK